MRLVRPLRRYWSPKTIPFILGLGVSYRNGDGTMGNLKEVPSRVLDTPVSEATTTGVAVGSAVTGMRPIIHHGRVVYYCCRSDNNTGSKMELYVGGNYQFRLFFKLRLSPMGKRTAASTSALLIIWKRCWFLR